MPFVPRLFLSSVSSGLSEIVLDASLSRYLVKVLRLKEGDKFLGFDGRGLEGELTLVKASAEEARASLGVVNQGRQEESRLFIALGQGLPKGSKMDLILRQGTEAGVHRFLPLVTQRSVARPEPSQYRHKGDRWGKILVEACRQCGRKDVPKLDPITPWKEALEGFAGFDLVLLPYEKEAPSLATVLESNSSAHRILALVGPEGGWSEEEVHQAQEKGAHPVHLPTPILRTETAGLAVVSMIRFFFSAKEDKVSNPTGA